MSNTIWSEWWNTDRFLNKPYPFRDNYCPPKIEIAKTNKKKKNK